jgi:ELWxxDGT repeat protein
MLLSNTAPQTLGDLRDSGASLRAQLAPLNGTVILSRNDGIHGDELWTSDGTKGGTVLLKDILPGPASSGPSQFVEYDGSVFFSVRMEPDAPFELWKTDGTTEGTTRVVTFYEQGQFGFTELEASAGLLYFGASGHDSGVGLWRTDGTIEGTYRIRDQRVHSLTDVSGKLFFVSNYDLPNELWITDGTAAGTMPLTDVPGSVNLTNVRHPVAVEDELFFTALTDTVGLYKSDGTPAGTVRIRKFDDDVLPIELAAVQDTLFIAVNNRGKTFELWKSNGTQTNTVRVKVIGPTTFPALLNNFTAVGDHLYFNGFDGLSGNELWRSDGTEAGTYMVADISPGGFGSVPASITDIGGLAYFSATNLEHGYEMWRSNGTAAGTVRLTEIGPGAEDSHPGEFLAISSSHILFNATTEQLGYELWSYSLRSRRPVVKLVRDADVTTDSSSPTDFVEVNGQVYFIARDFHGDFRLWVSNGRKASHVITGAPMMPLEPTAVGDTLFFSSFLGGLWKIDAAGTVSLMLEQGVASLSRCGDELYFAAQNGTEFAVWKTNGTPDGTVMLTSIVPKPGALPPRAFTLVGGKVFFVVTDLASGNEPWVSDGTPGGTHRVKDVNPGTGNSINNFVVFQDQYYFTATDGVHGNELWRTDGTEEGTVMITDLRPGSGGGVMSAVLRASDEAIFFRGFNPESLGSFTLWKTDGTAEGMMQIRTTSGGVTPEPSADSAVVGDQFFFIGTTPEHGPELWVADATAAHLVKDIGPGPATSSLADLTAANGLLYFRGIDLKYSSELWASDGTEAGTRRLTDINAGGASFITEVTAIGKRVYFSASDGVHGNEPWFIDVGKPPPTSNSRSFDLRFSVTGSTWRVGSFDDDQMVDLDDDFLLAEILQRG